MLVDTHCHLAATAFEADRDIVLERAWAAGVAHIVIIGESRETAERGLALAQREPRLSVVAGVHPHDARDWSPEAEKWLEALLGDVRVVAVGETGLDYHYDHSPRQAQHLAFEAQLHLARQVERPAVIHAREADHDVAAKLRANPDVVAVLHSFSSGPALLRAGLDLGHYVSFSGMVTFKNWALDDALRAVPLERLLLETDAPYLAPVPHRGKRNEPAFVRAVAERVAAVRGLATEELIEMAGRNARRVFGPRVGGEQ